MLDHAAAFFNALELKADLNSRLTEYNIRMPSDLTDINMNQELLDSLKPLLSNQSPATSPDKLDMRAFSLLLQTLKSVKEEKISCMRRQVMKDGTVIYRIPPICLQVFK